MKNSAKVTTALAILASDLAESGMFQNLSRLPIFIAGEGISIFMQDHRDIFWDETMGEELPKRFYKSIVVPWLNLYASDGEME